MFKKIRSAASNYYKAKGFQLPNAMSGGNVMNEQQMESEFNRKVKEKGMEIDR